MTYSFTDQITYKSPYMTLLSYSLLFETTKFSTFSLILAPCRPVQATLASPS